MASSRALAAALLLAPATPAGAGPGTGGRPDPTATGPHAVRIVEYDAGDVTIVAGNEVWLDRLRGAVFVPSGTGPFPVLLFLHGVSHDCYSEYDPVEEQWVDFVRRGPSPPWHECPDRVPNHRGYDYLATNLASHGYLVVSVLTGSRGSSGEVSGVTQAGAGARVEILERTLDRLQLWNTGPGPGDVGWSLLGKVDLDRIGAMGHSRGGEAVALLMDPGRSRPSGTRHHVDAALAIAPIDHIQLAPHGVPYAVVLPMCDADVVSTGGATAWDRGRFVDPAEPAPRTQFTVRGANHSYFNSVWSGFDEAAAYYDDPECGAAQPTTGRLSVQEQQRIGLALVAGFFRRYIGGETAFDPLMTGAAGLPAGTCPDGATTCPTVLGTSYLAPAADRALVVTPADGEAGSTRTDQGGPLALDGFAEARVCDSSPPRDGMAQTARIQAEFLVGLATGIDFHPEACPSKPTRSAARQLALRWDGPASIVATLAASPEGTFDASRFTALTFRTGVNFPAYGDPHPDVEVVLRDAAGRRASVSAAAHTTALRAPEGTVSRRLVLNGVRLPLAAFHGVGLGRLTAIELHFGRTTGPGSLQLAELAFQVS